MQRRHVLNTLVICLSLLPNLLGCAPAATEVDPVEDLVGARKDATTPTPRPAFTDQRVPDGKLAAQACPIAGANPEPPEGAALMDPGRLKEYLNLGGSLQDLQAALAKAGLLPQEGLGFVQSDFDGDGYLEAAFGFARSEQNQGQAGFLHFFLCRESHFELQSLPGRSISGASAVIHAAEDFDGDGSVDLLVTWQQCGAHTCFVHTALMMWRAGEMQNRLEGTSDDLASPEIQLVEPRQAGAIAIQITAQGVASAGAGPPRRVRRTWRWNPSDSTYKPEPDTLLPSNFRIHVLHDADAAARAGDFESALAGYLRVIVDDELEEWGALQQSRESLTAFAAFRRLHTLLILDDREGAAAALDTLRLDVPEGAPGSEYLELAEIFWGAFQSVGDVDEACSTALEQVTANPSRYLDPLYYGYANPVYETEDLCPGTG